MSLISSSPCGSPARRGIHEEAGKVQDATPVDCCGTGGSKFQDCRAAETRVGSTVGAALHYGVTLPRDSS